ncbi:Panacea domain-containing protein [Brachyspira hampsonii]|uniref:Antitoxin SocA-like Panacea domain-containing protein n=1 Tax=Brachyspira hampsonii TaxID=1287055 RepID=A0AAC9XKI9_9SPIR|nr:Panacea domain-containing protein [Brachyspira hampsonii]ASJ21506.1 hypothetical protein BHAMNSH16_07580 [Brachyspira hampsonii]ELV06121.1 hypothetical protein H263_06087 [Brachyspira hampsonii 30599]MBW5380061.1 DUF4065 domain-containing protein [Brachyspira hampsonii]MBW5410717.1 DUF4065 domain-containing protein [Brachyspira hampsonii]OEJ17992.1 hypothetical protein A9496_09305 [Brachyspira hampsonii]
MFIAYQIENAILFFAIKYHNITKKNLTQTKLYKFLAFLDFEIMEEYGEPALGLTYRAMKRGPVPIEIYEDKEYRNNDAYTFKKLRDNIYIIKVKNRKLLDLDYFSDIELDKMNQIVQFYIDDIVDTSEISELSHIIIKPWKRRYNLKENDIISYDEDVFIDVNKKNENDLTPAEIRYKMIKAFEELKK